MNILVVGIELLFWRVVVFMWSDFVCYFFDEVFFLELVIFFELSFYFEVEGDFDIGIDLLFRVLYLSLDLDLLYDLLLDGLFNILLKLDFYFFKLYLDFRFGVIYAD